MGEDEGEGPLGDREGVVTRSKPSTRDLSRVAVESPIARSSAVKYSSRASSTRREMRFLDDERIRGNAGTAVSFR